MSKVVGVLAALAFGAHPAPAAIDLGCPTAAPQTPCTADPPAAGESFSGPVLQVMDGRTVCVARGPLPGQWVRVVLADTEAAATRGALMAAAFARSVACISLGAGREGVRAICVTNGASISQLATMPDQLVAGRAWR